jgi:hypothetical protein
VKHNLADVSQNSESNNEDAQESQVLDQDGCEGQSDLNIGAKALVEELKNLVGVVDLVLADKPFILFLVKLFSLVSLVLLERHSQMRDGLEVVLLEETVSLLGVLEDAKEDWTLHFVLILFEGIHDCFKLVVYLAILKMIKS